MKYFTPELYESLQDFRDDKVMDTADARWQEAAERYGLARLRPKLPDGLRHLLETYYLHDADVLSMGQRRQSFVIVLRLDVPPRELLVLQYRLIQEPTINRDVFKQEHAAEAGPVQWMYDEVDRIARPPETFTHSILLSNGWEIQLCVRDVKVVRSETVFPGPGTNLVPVHTALPAKMDA